MIALAFLQVKGFVAKMQEKVLVSLAFLQVLVYA